MVDSLVRPTTPSRVTSAEPSPDAVGALAWLNLRRRTCGLEFQRIPFSESREWSFDEARGRLRHHTGSFFAIEGLRARAGRPAHFEWLQPIIDQPEIGVLGFLAQHRDRVLHLLVQSKAEPGNIGGVQLAPTVQATWSNYTRAHHGKPTLFLDHFLKTNPEQILVDQLQSEQGSRFLGKRNRNMVVMLPSSARLEVDENVFRWLPLPVVQELLGYDHVVNTDARSVLACLQACHRVVTAQVQGEAAGWWSEEIALSAATSGEKSACSETELLAWLCDRRCHYRVERAAVPLGSLEGWTVGRDEISRSDGRGLQVIAISVDAPDREVPHWDQPIVTSPGVGRVVFLCRRVRGVLHFLVQARPEPGTFDSVELCPTIQLAGDEHERTPYLGAADAASPEQVIVHTRQSEEGGRFFQDEVLYQVVLQGDAAALPAHDDYRWLTLGQIDGLLRFSNVFTNEARSLLAQFRPSGLERAPARR